MNPKKNKNHHEEKKDVFDAKNSFPYVYDEKLSSIINASLIKKKNVKK